MRRAALMVVATMAVLVLGSARPHACSCVGPASPCSAVWDYPDVFVASVTSIGPLQAIPGRFGETRAVTMRITETLKGTATDVVQVVTARDSDACGYAFATGRSYLVYAYRLKDTGELGTGICTRTAPVGQAAADLIYLRGAFRASSTRGSIEGDVMRHVPSELRAPFDGVTIVLQGADGRHETRTGADGLFSFRVPAGQYLVSARVPLGWSSWYDEPRPVELRDPRGCALLSISVQPNGRIAGRLLESSGVPVPLMTVEAVRASDLGRRTVRATEKTVTKAGGEYELHHLPAGQYLIGLTLGRDAGTAGDTAVWFPAGSHETAWRTVLETGQRVSVDDVSLPAGVTLALLTGTVVGAGEVPSAGTRVYVLGPTSAVGIVAGPVETDASGQFRITVIAGRDYRLSAEHVMLAGGLRTLHRAEALRFTATPDLPPFRLRLQKP